MSSGPFIRTKYQDNLGNVYRVRVQPETELLQNSSSVFNSATTSGLTVPISANASGSRRQNGVNVRKVGIKFPAGQEPSGYESGEILYIPILTQAFFITLAPDDTVTYLGGQATIVSTVAEKLN